MALWQKSAKSWKIGEQRSELVPGRRRTSRDARHTDSAIKLHEWIHVTIDPQYASQGLIARAAADKILVNQTKARNGFFRCCLCSEPEQNRHPCC